ncbi:hypothetical protein CerSpe_107050 [Prunus speciosa]
MSNRYSAFLFLAQSLNSNNLIHRPDECGNTVLHLAISTRNFRLAEYIIDKTEVDRNGRNHRGLTGYDILNREFSIMPGNQHVRYMLKRIVINRAMKNTQRSLSYSLCLLEQQIKSTQQRIELSTADQVLDRKEETSKLHHHCTLVNISIFPVTNFSLELSISSVYI